jgi:hypothetical protein
MKQEVSPNQYWTNGCHLRRILSEDSFIQVMAEGFGTDITIRQYPKHIGGIDDLFDSDSGWMECTQDEFITAYCKAINRISEASGIEHLPLNLEVTAYAD